MRRQSKHKSSTADTDTSMLRREGRSTKNTNSVRYVIAFFCVASLLVFLFRPAPGTRIGKTKVLDTSKSSQAIQIPSADIVQECLFNLKHYHEVLTDWFSSGDITMTDEELWEQLKFSDDMVLFQSNGSELDVRGIKSVLIPAKGSAPGWATVPTEITAEMDADNKVTVKFIEHQKSAGKVIVMLDSVALCRQKASSSDKVDFETEFYSLKEKIHKQGAALKEHNDS
ncbi:hypothetical protein BSKO_06286 [Bryopsis sp. KO-2023]|nr:hypothetical protein BSKO_06286 [Bryopsis sp. KO-2023]